MYKKLFIKSENIAIHHKFKIPTIINHSPSYNQAKKNYLNKSGGLNLYYI